MDIHSIETNQYKKKKKEKKKEKKNDKNLMRKLCAESSKDPEQVHV